MDERNVLRHLLGVEAEAAALAEEAQAEADRRIASAEKDGRLRFDGEYSRRAAELEAASGRELAAVREDYGRRLGEYRESLAALSPDQGRFAALVEELLLRGER